MPSFFSPMGSTPRKRANSESNPYRYLMDPNNAYVPMQYYNLNSSPRFAGMPLSPNMHPGQPAFGPGMGGGMPMGQAGYQAYPWAWPSPHMFPMDLTPPAPQAFDPRMAAIHVLLAPANPMAQQPHALYDVRFKPDKCYMTAMPQPIKVPDEFLDQPATNPPMAKIRLVCRDIPWRITASNAKGVTLKDILNAVYTELQTPLTEGEWWIAQEQERERTLQAYQANCSEDVPDSGEKRKLEEGVRRVDWLDNKTMLMSISRTRADEGFIKARIPEKAAQMETWVVEFGDAAA